MLRFLIILLASILSIWSTYALPRVSPIEMSRDLKSILQGWSQLWEIGPGSSNSTELISEKYFHDLDTFASKYSAPYQSLILRPTIDRSLSYRLHIQDYSLSCEIAALQIVMHRLGISLSEKQIFVSIPQYPQAYGTGGIWWDPDIEFVGYYTGGQTQQTWYGIYEAPLAKYAQDYSLRTRILNESSHIGWLTPATHLSELLSTLDDTRSHVILWGDWCTETNSEDGFFPKWGKSILRFFPLPARNKCWRSATERILRWTTPSGKKITGLSGEHAFVLLGYIGSPKSPSHIIVWDTYTGRHVYSYAEWMRKWSLMQYRSLIISQ